MPEADIAAVRDQIAGRAEDFAASGRAARRALRVPFVDDVADFLPREAPIGLRAAVALIVRSPLEPAHAAGVLDDQNLATLTTLATAALSVWLGKRPVTAEDDPPAGVFAAVADHPRALAALKAVALAAENGQRFDFPCPDGPAPALPLSSGPATVNEEGFVRRSGVAAIDDVLAAMLHRVAGGQREILLLSSLSRLSRDVVVLAQLLEFILAHRGSVLTTNLLIRPGDAYARTAPLVGAVTTNPLQALSADRLRGVHAKTMRSVLADLS